MSLSAEARRGGHQVEEVSLQAVPAFALRKADRQPFAAIATTLTILEVIRKLYGTKLELHDDYFDKVLGTADVRVALEKGLPCSQIVQGFQAELVRFERLRQSYLLYH